MELMVAGMPEIVNRVPTLLIATRNPGKMREVLELLSGLSLGVLDGSELPEVEETGATFEANALLKAIAASRHAGTFALADDSGLEVDVLGGGPGVLSARFGSPEVTTAEGRNALLLRRLVGVPDDQRTARFRCAVALAAPDGQTWVTEGTCEGQIGHGPRGLGGFGYDPLFFMPDRGCTMAELPPEEKNAISHRGSALAAMRPILRRVVGGEW